MQVFVRNTDGKTFTVNIEATDKIERLAAYVRYKTDIVFHRIRLICNGRPLDWDDTLAEAGVVANSTVHLLVRMGDAASCPFCGGERPDFVPQPCCAVTHGTLHK